MKCKAVTLALLAGALVAAPFAASEPAAGKPCGKDNGLEHMCKKLSLKDDQKTRITELHKQMREAAKPLFEQLKGARQEIRKELLKPTPSKDALAGFSAQIGEIHKQLAEKRTDHLLQVKTILTPEQFSKLLDREEMAPGCRMKGKEKGAPCCPHGKMGKPDAD